MTIRYNALEALYEMTKAMLHDRGREIERAAPSYHESLRQLVEIVEGQGESHGQAAARICREAMEDK